MGILRSNVPLPKTDRSQYRFGDRVEGDSVFFEDATSAARYAAAFYSWRNTHGGLKILRRKVGADDPDGEGYRIWFIADDESVKARQKWDFSKVMPGHTMDVRSEAERAAVLNAWKYWVNKAVNNPMGPQMRAAGAYARSERVDGGYRIYFRSEKMDRALAQKQEDI